MHSSMPLNTLSFILLLFLLVQNAHSTGVTFTSPGGGATWPPGIVNIAWADAGGDPDMAQLDSYTLQLMVGGNSEDDSEVLQTIGSANGSVATGHVQGNIAANIASSVEDGFYLRMTSNTTDGNQVINYSNRFTLINMKGTTSQVYLDGANAAAGATDVPTAQYKVIETVTPTSSSSSSSTTASATASITQSPASQQNNQDDLGDSGPDKLTKTGLIIGGIFAVIGAASIFLWMRLLWRKRRQRQGKERERKEIQARRRTAALMEFKVELPGESHPVLRSRPSELSPETERYEVGGRERAIEMQATNAVFELEGNHTPVYEAGSGRRSKAYEPSIYEAGSGRRSKAYDPTL